MSTGSFLVRAIACIKPVTPAAEAAGAAAAVPGAPQQLEPDQNPVVDLLGNGLMVVYLVDEGDRFVWVQHRHLRAINANPRGLMEFGLVNLKRLAQGKLKVMDHGAIHGLLLDGQFEASLILIDELWDQALAKMTPNGAVVALPARDVLAFCDAASAQGVRELRELVQRVLPGNDHPLTDRLYRRVNGAWQPLP